jgi:hypothetical protein
LVSDAKYQYEEAVADALTKYVADLKAAKAAAMKADNLEEAILVDAELKESARELKETRLPRRAGPALQITEATWGSGAKRVDITDAARRQVRDGGFRLDGLALPDPTPDVLKTLTIRGTYGVEEWVLICKCCKEVEVSPRWLK